MTLDTNFPPLTTKNSDSFYTEDTNQRMIKQFVGYCHHELYDISLCSECYRSAAEGEFDWFTNVCDYPHVIVWARWNDQYLPAKAMGFKQTAFEPTIYVRFFGTKKFANVDKKECFLFSHEHPQKKQFDEVVEQKEARMVSC